MFQHSTSLPTKKDFAYVHKVPGPLFTDDIQPASEPHHVYRLRMNKKAWTSWSGNSFGIRYSDGSPFEATIKGSTLTTRDRMILRDSKGVVIGVILKMFFRMQQTFKIYGIRPFKKGQAPSEQTYNGKALYAWAVITGEYLSVQRVMKMADGTTYVANQVGSFVGPQHMNLTYNGRVCASAKQTNWAADLGGTMWDLTIGPGVDPCLICCFIAAVDEMKENRRQENGQGAVAGIVLLTSLFLIE